MFCPAGSNLREPVRYDAFHKCICRAEVRKSQQSPQKMLVGRELALLWRDRTEAGDAIHYDSNVEDCSTENREKALQENADIVNSVSYKGEGKRVANCNGCCVSQRVEKISTDCQWRSAKNIFSADIYCCSSEPPLKIMPMFTAPPVVLTGK